LFYMLAFFYANHDINVR